jgi:hypothetical protein
MNRSLARLIFCCTAIAAMVAAIPGAWVRRALAGSLSTDVIGMFPKEVSEFAYADMKAARSRPWFPQLRDQLLPGNFRQFEQFLSAAGIDPNTQVDEMAWAIVTPAKDSGEQILGVALGSFTPSAIEDKLKQQKVPSVEVHGYHLYAFGSGSGPSDILFFFLDSNTAAFGNRTALEKLIDVHFGGSESLLRNDQMFQLISEANGHGTLWAALDQHYTHIAMAQMLPQASQFPQAQAIIDRLKAMEIYVTADSGVDAHFSAVCSSVDDANVLAAAAQAGVMYRRYQEAQSHPEVAKALDSVSIAPAGDRLKVEVPITEDQLNSLIKSKAFVLQM